MANEKIEIEVIVNGQKAKVELDKVAKATDSIGASAKETDGIMNTTIGNIKVGWLAVAGVVAKAAQGLSSLTKHSLAVEKATWGMSDATKQYIQDMSSLYGINQEVIAGFVRTGESSGMSTIEIKKMIDTAVALGRAFPHESIESFIDNLSMLNTSQEAQGFIVDVLEKKWGTIDLKGKSLTEMLDRIREVTTGVNDEFNKTASSKIDGIFVEATNAASSFVQKLISIGNNTGWLDDMKSGLQTIARYFKEIDQYNTLDVNLELIKKTRELKQAEEDWYLGGEVAKKRKIDSIQREIIALNAQGKKIQDNALAEQIADQKIKATREERLTQERAAEEERKKADEEKKAREQEEIARQKQLLADKSNAEKSFLDDYKYATMSEYEYEMANLKDRYSEYSKFINDKAKLDEWYSKSSAEITKQYSQEQQEMEQIHDNVVGSMSQAITDFVMTGKMNFKSLMQSILAYIIQLQVAKMVSGALGFFGLHTGGVVSKHTGGSIGSVPSYHSGLRSDERLAKLQVGEAVINRAGARNNAQAIDAMNRGEKVGGWSNITTADITFNVTAIDSNSFNSYLVNNRSTIEGIINKSLTTNGSVRQTIKQVV